MQITHTTPKTEVEERHLYVPSGIVSWDAQVQHGHKLFKKGYTVWVHRHGWGLSCSGEETDSVAPSGGCLALIQETA